MTKNENLVKFGFKFGQNGAHSARTMMLAEISQLFDIQPVDAKPEEYKYDIEVANVLHKPTSRARTLTWRHLVDLYGMDTQIPLFRIFRLLWESDEKARPLLACQMSLTRDPILRLSKPKILSLRIGEHLPREGMEQAVIDQYPDRFSPAMLKSMAQNVNGTWTRAGYLSGRNKKIRSEPDVRPVNVAFSLFLGYLEGATGNRLFSTEWSQMLECRRESLIELARLASHRGLLNFKHSSEVIEVTFPDYLTQEEEAWLYE